MRTMRHLAQIPGGEIAVWLDREEIPLHETLDFAARHNANRHFLFVSKVLGRHIPTRPQALRSVAAALAARIPREPTTMVVGMAETATTLGQAVFREWTQMGGCGLYVDTTRRRTGGTLAFEFTESHSHAPGHAVHLPGPADDPTDVFHRAERLVIIDDEATTGRTAVALHRAYSQCIGRDLQWQLAVIVHWLNEEASHEVESLIEGTFAYTTNGQPAEAFAPIRPADTSSLSQKGTRHGIARPQVLSPANRPDALAYKDKKVLVVGVGEFGFLPLVLAEAIEDCGGTAWLQATTRSPVRMGAAIGHARAFPAITGEPYEEYLYNVPDAHSYDHVIICGEDAAPPTSHPIFAIPRSEWHQLTPVLQ